MNYIKHMKKIKNSMTCLKGRPSSKNFSYQGPTKKRKKDENVL
jgi:hypothetical protein